MVLILEKALAVQKRSQGRVTGGVFGVPVPTHKVPDATQTEGIGTTNFERRS